MLADEGLLAVARVFPTETATVIIFIVILVVTGIWYKNEIDRVA